MKWLNSLCFLVVLPFVLQATQAHKQPTTSALNYNSRSDTFDVRSYHIQLDISDFTNKKIVGNCEIDVRCKINNIQQIVFDLQQLSVDSIHLNNTSITAYQHTNNFLIIQLAASMNINDSARFNIFYHGTPFNVSSGFGGFYFTGNIAYNMGVGIGVDPPNMGRAWFPCFDNFVQRSSYEFTITTLPNNKAFCNGTLLNETLDSINQKKIWHYKLAEKIPTYLACVAVGPYATIHQTFSGLNGPMPVELGALATDTTLLKNCFVHLENAFDFFEEAFGPYRWEKVGYSLVPFNNGAMEHATNISYPRPFVDAQGTYEAEMMAHELAHHWFGDLVTCETAGDMWLNEGWANFCGLYFLEKQYDTARYISNVKSKLDDVLHYAHHSEGAYRPVANIPDSLTYGTHVYDKGALVAHSLRAYLGTEFFNALKMYMLNNPYKKTNSSYFKSQLEQYSGKNLNDFFNNYVLDGGFTHVAIDSFATTSANNAYDVTVYVHQTLTGTNNYYHHLPLDITFHSSNQQTFTATDTCNGVSSVLHFNVPFDPSYCTANESQRLATSQVLEQKTLVGNGAANFSLGKINATITNFSDTFQLSVAHVYAAAAPFKSPKPYRLSPQRHWLVYGNIPQGTGIKAFFKYNGRTTSASGDNFLDDQLNIVNEDSLSLMYRTSAKDDWKIVSDTTWQRGIKTDKSGTVSILNLKAGEYCFAKKDYMANIELLNIKQTHLKVFPNPSDGIINLDADENGTAFIYNATGNMIGKYELLTGMTKLNLSNQSPGVYTLKFYSKHQTENHKLVLTK